MTACREDPRALGAWRKYHTHETPPPGHDTPYLLMDPVRTRALPQLRRVTGSLAQRSLLGELPICLGSGVSVLRGVMKRPSGQRDSSTPGNKDKMGRTSDKVNNLHPDV